MLNPEEEQQVAQSKISNNIWSCASTTAKKVNLSDFFKALAVFIWEKWHEKRENLEGSQPDFRLDRNFAWVANYLVQIHGSITT